MQEGKDYGSDFKKLLSALEKNKKQAKSLKGDKSIRADDLPLISEVIGMIEEIFPNHIILLYGEGSNIIYISEHVKNVLGYTATEFVRFTGEEVAGRIHPDDFEPVAKVLASMHGGTMDYRFEMNFRFLFQGTDSYVHVSYEPVKFIYRSYFVTCAVIRDIGKEVPFRRVTLKIKKRIGKQFVQVNEIVAGGQTELVTHREQEIMNLIHKGMTSSEIAAALSISQNTVKNHRRNLFKKLNVKSSIDLINILNRNQAGSIEQHDSLP